MIVIGLTGGIGSGKSTVSRLLTERGAVVIDADAIVRELQQPGQPVLAQIAERFGPEVIRPDGHLDRPAMARIVFNDPDQLAALTAITRPAMVEEIRRRVASYEGTDRVVVLDVALLVENREDYEIQALVVVDTPLEKAVERVVADRGMDPDDVWARIANQASPEERRAVADWVIDNSGTLADLEAQVDALWAWLPSLEGTPAHR